mmetsp:Transcript_4422/g.6682  ORF Transcript_4422/g.6682 Transcript_4422/m.6682 type:complete len:219 (-) Transcript_4422:1721-2377(-)
MFCSVCVMLSYSFKSFISASQSSLFSAMDNSNSIKLFTCSSDKPGTLFNASAISSLDMVVPFSPLSIPLIAFLCSYVNVSKTVSKASTSTRSPNPSSRSASLSLKLESLFSVKNVSISNFFDRCSRELVGDDCSRDALTTPSIISFALALSPPAVASSKMNCSLIKAACFSKFSITQSTSSSVNRRSLGVENAISSLIGSNPSSHSLFSTSDSITALS